MHIKGRFTGCGFTTNEGRRVKSTLHLGSHGPKPLAPKVDVSKAERESSSIKKTSWRPQTARTSDHSSISDFCHIVKTNTAYLYEMRLIKFHYFHSHALG